MITSLTTGEPRKKLTVPALQQYKVRDGQIPLVMVTAYDAPTASLAADAGVDLLLVGDSVGTALLGFDSTVPVTLEMIVHHLAAVRRGAPDMHIVADLPFGTYQESDEQAIENAVTLMKAGADSVKLEGGSHMAERVAAMVAAGIPVMGHVGLTPQTAGMLGGFKVQGKDLESAGRLIADAAAVQNAGAFALVVEVVPSLVGKLIADSVNIPVIGIGAGADTDGQVLVWTDLAGLTQGHLPKFAKQYANLASQLRNAFGDFAAEVRERRYPDSDHQYPTPDELKVLDPAAVNE